MKSDTARLARAPGDLLPGDHVAVPIAPRVRHHGVYLGDGEVAHWNDGREGKALGPDLRERMRHAAIRVTSVEIFAAGRPLIRLEEPAAFDAAEICARARSRVGETGYCLASNNCEHFVRWCRSGRRESRQVTETERCVKALGGSVARSLTVRCIRRAAPALLRAGARGGPLVSVAVEVVECGTRWALGRVAPEKPALARRGGRAASGVGMALAGMAGGGPVGALAGLAVWAAGEAGAKAALAGVRRAVRRGT